MIEKIVKFQIKYSKLLLILLLTIIVSATIISLDLKVDPDFGTLIPQDSEFNTNDQILKKTFETNNAMILYLSIDDKSQIKNISFSIRTKNVENYLKDINMVLSQSQYVTSISNPRYSNNSKSVEVLINLRTPNKIGSVRIVKGELENLINQVGTPVGVKKIVTGFPVLIDKIPTLLIADNLNTIFITLIAIFLILYWYSRDFYFTFSTVAVPTVSLILLGAFMVILNINVTVTLAAVGVLILGLGADYSIHISTHYTKARKKYKGEHDKALIETIQNLILPVTVSFITTLAGFSALLFGVSPSSQSQGLVLSLGIALIYATTIILFPIFSTIFANKINIKPNKVLDKILESLVKLAKYQIKYSKSILFIIFVVTMIMFYGATKVQFSTSNSNWIPDNDPVSKSFREVTNNFDGKTDVISIILISNSGDLREVKIAKDLKLLKVKLESIPNVDFIQSPYTNLNFSQSEIYNELTYNKSLRNQFNHDWTLTKINILTKNPERDINGKSTVLKEIKMVLKNSQVYNTRTSLYGDLVRFDELGDSLKKDIGVTTLVSFGLVLFVISTIYASLMIGFLSILPILIALIWSIGLMGFFSVPFTSLSTGIISLVLGIGVDFSIHLVDGIKRYSKIMEFSKAVFETMNSSGKAIFLSSITTLFGFLALTFAQLLGTKRLGWSLSFSIISVFFVTVLFVPTILSLLNKRKLKLLNKNKK